jgi:predicted GTPase
MKQIDILVLPYSNVHHNINIMSIASQYMRYGINQRLFGGI